MSLLFMAAFVHSQENFYEVDSISYSLYQNRDWKRLTTFGSNSFAAGYDYFYLNVRTGIAYFERGNYKIAEIWFRRALKNNSASTFAKEYLFWTLYNSGAQPEASKIYKELPDSVQSKMDYKLKKVFNSLYVEAGVKFSSNKSNANNLYYAAFSMDHLFSPRVGLTQSYVFMNQKTVWGNMLQQQYILTPIFNLNKKWKISMTFNYANYKSNLNYNDTFNWQNTTQGLPNGAKGRVDTVANENYSFKGAYKQNALLTQLNINKRAGNWSITPHISIYSQWANPNYNRVVEGKYQITSYSMNLAPVVQNKSDTVLTNYTAKSKFISAQFGLDLNYTILNRLTLGLDANFVHYTGFNKFNVSPYFRLMISKRISIFGYYVSKKNYLLSINGGTFFLNSYDVTKNKISLTLQFILSRKIQLFTTYQHETDTDYLSLRDYQLNSVFLGLKIKL